MTFKSNLKKKRFFSVSFCFYFCYHVTQSHSIKVSTAFVDSKIFCAIVYMWLIASIIQFHKKLSKSLYRSIFGFLFAAMSE